MEILWKAASLFSSCFKQYMCHSTKLNMEIFWKLSWHKQNMQPSTKLPNWTWWWSERSPACSPGPLVHHQHKWGICWQLCTVTFPMDASLFYWPTLHSGLSNGCQLVLLAILFFPHKAKHLLTLHAETMFFQMAQEKWRWFVISNFGWPAVTVNNCDIQIPLHE